MKVSGSRIRGLGMFGVAMSELKPTPRPAVALCKLGVSPATERYDLSVST